MLLSGYIPISALKEILHELDPKLSDDELDGIIAEIDTDGSGTVDFDGTQSFYLLICEWIFFLLYLQNSWK